MAGHPLIHVRDKAGKYGVLLEEAVNPGSGCSLLSVPYMPGWLQPLAEAEYINNNLVISEQFK